MNIRLYTIVALLLIVGASVTGCGSSTEDSKPPQGSNYYKGEMQPKGGAPGTKANTKAGAVDQ